MSISISDINSYICQIESDAESHLDYVKNKVWDTSSKLPIPSREFPDISQYRNKLSSFFSGTDFKYDIDTGIVFLDEVTTDSVSNFIYREDASGSSPDPIFKIDSAETLKKILGELSSTKPDSTVDVVEPKLPTVVLTSFPPLPNLPPFKFETYEQLKRPLFESSYLDSIGSYFSAILEKNNIKNIFSTGIAKKISDLKILINSEFAKTAETGMRKPNSATIFNCRAHYEKFIYSLLDLSKEYVDTLGALLLSAQKAGISKEQIQIDFTKHINDLKSELLRFTVDVYTAKLSFIIKKFNALTEKAAIKVTVEMTKAERDAFASKIEQLAQENKLAKLQAETAYAKGISEFAGLYSQNNKEAIEKKLLDLDKKLFEKTSELFKKQADISVNTKELGIKQELIQVNSAITKQQATILSTDLEAYNDLSELHGMKVKALLTEFDAVLKELKLKTAGYSELDKLANASNEIVKAINASQIELATVKGTGDPSWLS